MVSELFIHQSRLDDSRIDSFFWAPGPVAQWGQYKVSCVGNVTVEFDGVIYHDDQARHYANKNNFTDDTLHNNNRRRVKFECTSWFEITGPGMDKPRVAEDFDQAIAVLKQLFEGREDPLDVKLLMHGADHYGSQKNRYPTLKDLMERAERKIDYSEVRYEMGNMPFLGTDGKFYKIAIVPVVTEITEKEAIDEADTSDYEGVVKPLRALGYKIDD